VGQPVESQFTAVDGRKVDMASMRGKVVLVDFWATWCPPCLAALPVLKAEYENYHGRGFEVVGVSWDQEQGKLIRFVAADGMRWPQYFEGPYRKLGESFGIGGIPYTFLVDRKGRLRAATAFSDSPDFTGLIPKLLAE
jgi:thiol-disulfide isomerase/thioredoxin